MSAYDFYENRSDNKFFFSEAHRTKLAFLVSVFTEIKYWISTWQCGDWFYNLSLTEMHYAASYEHNGPKTRG
jgi:hypothetical protein